MSDNLETGPQSIEQILDSQFSEQEEPTEAVEGAPQEATEEVEATSDEVETEEEVEEEIDETTDPETESQEPQHLSLEEYGELTIPIVVDGVETQVNLSEAAKGYQLQADYSRKTAALANERKEMDSTLQQERAAIADKQRLLDEQLAQHMEQEPDWVKMATEDPLNYLPAKEKWNQQQAARAEAQGRRNRTKPHSRGNSKQRQPRLLFAQCPNGQRRLVLPRTHKDVCL